MVEWYVNAMSNPILNRLFIDKTSISNKNATIFIKISDMKIYQHVLFWVISMLLLVLVFGRSFGSSMDAFFFVTMLTPVIVGTNYYFNYALVPNYLSTKRKWKFGLYTIYMLIISIYLEMVVITLSFIYLANYEYKNMSPLCGDVIILGITMYLLILLFSFVLLVQRSFNQGKNIENLLLDKEKRTVGFLTVRVDRKKMPIEHDKISIIESLAYYVKIHYSETQSVITKEKISKMAERLPDNFVRIHRSYIINVNNVTSYNKESVSVNEVEYPIGRSYKAKVMDKF